MVSYRVDAYRSRPTGASLLCLALKGLHTDAGWAATRHVATGCTVVVFTKRHRGTNLKRWQRMTRQQKQTGKDGILFDI